MAVVKEIISDNCVIRIHDDCFEDEASVEKRLQIVAKIIEQAYKERALRLVGDANSKKGDKYGLYQDI